MVSIEKDVPRIRLGSIVEALDVIPHLLGFQPVESLVIMVACEGRVKVTARVDLEALRQPFVLPDLLGRLWARFPTGDAHVIAYSADHEGGWQALDACDAWLVPRVHRTLTLVDGARWQTEGPEGPSGRLGGWDCRVTAEAVFHGLVARGSRDELAATIAGPRASEVEHLQEVIERQRDALAEVPVTQWLTEVGKAIRGFRPDQGIEDDEAARLAIMVRDPEACQVAVLSITAQDSDHHRALWTAVVRRCPPEWQGEPLGVLGMACWAGGDGAMLTICLERAEVLVPDSDLVGILSNLINGVVPPTAWEDLRRQLLRSAPPRVRRTACPPPSRRRR